MARSFRRGQCYDYILGKAVALSRGLVGGVCAAIALAGSAHADFAVDTERYCSSGRLQSFNGATNSGSWFSLCEVTIKNRKQTTSDCDGAFKTQNSGIQT